MFCQKCGKEVNDDAVVCIHCGCAIQGAKKKAQAQKPSTGNQVLGAIIGAIVALILFAIVFPLVI